MQRHVRNMNNKTSVECKTLCSLLFFLFTIRARDMTCADHFRIRSVSNHAATLRIFLFWGTYLLYFFLIEMSYLQVFDLICNTGNIHKTKCLISDG